MLTLLGVEEPDRLVGNLTRSVGVDAETARKLADAVALSVFKPIRERLQGRTGGTSVHRRETVPVRAEPSAREKREAAETLARAGAASGADGASPAYAPGQKSSERKAVNEDPYREPIE